MKPLLFLSQSLPFPPESGGTQRAYNILRELEKGFRVHLVSFSRRQHQPTPEARANAEHELGQRLTSVLPSVPYPAEWSRFQRAWDHMRSTATGKAYSYFQYGGPGFASRLDEALCQVSPALVHFDSIDFFRWLDRFEGIPVTCTHHDIESHLLRRRSSTARSPVAAAYIRHQSRLVERVEASYAPRFALNLTMSKRDSARLRSIAPSANIKEVPNAVDTRAFAPTSAAHECSDMVVFVGPTYLFANRDAAEFLLKDIWPLVRRARPGATLTMVGRNSPGETRAFSSVPGVKTLGRVEAIQPHVGTAVCSVIPIRVGGGTRIKLLESWAMGKAVVSTTVGCEGLDARNGENLLIRDSPEEFARAVTDVLADRGLRDRLGAEGRRTVEEQYSWDAVGTDLRRKYNELSAG